MFFRRSASDALLPTLCFGLLLILSAVACFPAHADGYWLLHVDVVGKPTESPTPGGPPATWTPPADNHNTISLPSWNALSKGSVATGSKTFSSSVSLSVKITGTWMGSDPVPPSVEIIESGTAQYGGSGPNATATGTAANGLGDPVVTTATSGIAQTPSAVPPAHLSKQSSTSWSLTKSFSASCNLTVTGNGQHGYYCQASSGFTSYTISVHAQPYNWHITNVVNNGDGSLTYYYDWQSTSGSKADLGSCYIHEYVTYPGPIGTAQFPLAYTMPAPFNGALNNPTVLPGTGVNGQTATDPNGGYDHQGMPPLSSISPHVAGGFTATQKYEFDDTVTGETDTLIPGPDSGPLSIVRSVYSSGGILWYYSLTKSGYTVTKSI